MRRAYLGRLVLSGRALLPHHAIVARDGDIEAGLPVGEIAPGYRADLVAL